MMICNDWIQRSLVCDNQSKKINKYKYRTDRVLKDILWHILAVKRCNENNWAGRRRRSEFDFSSFDADSDHNGKILGLDSGFEDFDENDENAKKEFNQIVNQNFEKFENEISKINIQEMYDEFLSSKLSEILYNDDLDLLSNDMMMTPFDENDGRGTSKADKAKIQCDNQMNRLWLRNEIQFCGKLGAWKRRINSLHSTVSILQRQCQKKKNLRWATIVGFEAEEELEDSIEEVVSNVSSELNSNDVQYLSDEY